MRETAEFPHAAGRMSANLSLCYSLRVGGSPGIYVEIVIKDELEHVWRLTQDPALHQRWDLRFSKIEYLPRPIPTEPQRFLYETRIGLGLSIRGTGESVGERASASGDTTSSLKFASSDPKSLIREGSGYWRYVPTAAGLRFFTWYDYSVRFGTAGWLVDRLLFRPLMGWATAWSFDRMKIWAEEGQTPETSLALSMIHATARIAIAAVWIWHGLVPKLIYRSLDEQTMLAQAGVALKFLPWIGGLEVLVGLFILLTWHWRAAFAANAFLMILALIAVAINSRAYLEAAFNPVSLNLAVIALSIAGWIASRRLPSSKTCLRSAQKEQA
jgi:DoxX-like family